MYLKFSTRKVKHGETVVVQLFQSERASGVVRKNLVCHLGSLKLGEANLPGTLAIFYKKCDRKIESKFEDRSMTDAIKEDLRDRTLSYLQGDQNRATAIKKESEK